MSYSDIFNVSYYLDKTERLLDKVYSIGVWYTSDDSSENRRRRKLLREADWEASAAYRAAEQHPELQAELKALVAFLEPLPDMVSDIAPDHFPELDYVINQARERVNAIRERARRLGV